MIVCMNNIAAFVVVVREKDAGSRLYASRSRVSITTQHTELLPQRPRTLVRLWLIPITDDIQRVANADNADALVVSSHGYCGMCCIAAPYTVRHLSVTAIYSSYTARTTHHIIRLTISTF